jgi:hypothetical protein
MLAAQELLMTIERVVRMLAGTVVVVSLALGAPGSPVFVRSAWLWLAVFAGANLLQSGLTGFCPPEILMKKLGLGRGAPSPRSGRA